MRLEWKTIYCDKIDKENEYLEIPVNPFFFTLKDDVRSVFRYGRLTSNQHSDTVEEQFRYLLSLFKQEGSEKNHLSAVLVMVDECQPGIDIIQTELKKFNIKLKIKRLSPTQVRMLRLELKTGEIWVPKERQKSDTHEKKSAFKKPMRVLVVEDSIPIQKILTKVYSRIPNVEIVGIVAKVDKAIECLNETKPDFISLDLKLEGGSGLDFLRKVDFVSYAKKNFAQCVLVTDCSLNEGGLVFEAMKLGASTYFQKPQASNLSQFSDELGELIKEMFFSDKNVKKNHSKKIENINLDQMNLIAIGSSTGGTEIVIDIVRGLPQQSPPVLIVQHMPAQFTGHYAERISKQTGKPTVEVKERVELLGGHAYVAAGGLHMIIEKHGKKIFATPKSFAPVNRFKPSVSVLFESILEAELASKTLSIMLTGMGRDGAEEMLKLKRSGSITVGQSKESCAVYGMPRAAEELGALCYSASPEEIIKAVQVSII